MTSVYSVKGLSLWRKVKRRKVAPGASLSQNYDDLEKSPSPPPLTLLHPSLLLARYLLQAPLLHPLTPALP